MKIMRQPSAPWKSLLLAWLLPCGVFAGTYTNNFNSLGNSTPNGAINTAINIGGGLLNGVAANAQIMSSKKDTNNTGSINVAIVKTNVGSGSATALRLADKATTFAYGALIIPVIDGTSIVDEFTVTLDLLMDKTAGATAADGFNISFGPGLSGTGATFGHPSAYGLVVNFDTYANNASTDPRSIEVLTDGGVAVANFLAAGLPGGNFTYDQTFRTIRVHWDKVHGLSLTYDGMMVFSNAPTPGFIPTAGCNFAINGATGGSMQDVYIDNLLITTAKSSPLFTGGVVIEEIMADNASGLEDEDLDRPDWIDLYNGTASAVNIGGWLLNYTSAPIAPPGITPPPINYTLPSITIPAYGHQLVFASAKNRYTNVRPHSNFKLMKEGGTLALVQADGTTVAHTLIYGAQKEDLSYGGLGASQTPGYLEEATPGANNIGRQADNARASDPLFLKPGVVPATNQPSAVIAEGTSIELQIPTNAPPGAEIRYTLNTGEPLETSMLYTGMITITASTVIKAKVFAPGWLPSKTGNRAFIWLSSATDTNATNLINVASNYSGSGQAFSSSLPVLVLDSYLRNVDALTSVTGLRPYRFTQLAVYEVKSGTGRASLSNGPDQMLRAGTHVRGQSSATQPQKPYALELWKQDEDTDRSESLLGMPADSDWVLVSLTMDKSLMRNYLMQQAMLEANGPGAGIRCRYVEVFFNQGNSTLDYADYRGVYLLAEKISRGKDRVNIAKLNDSMSDPALTSGGFIFKNDKTPYDYPINATNNPAIPGSARIYDIYEPDPPTATQTNALVNWLNQMTAALASRDFNNPASPNYYGHWLDERSFIDKTLWLEFCKETDGYVYSSYFSKDRNGLLRAFPFWDVDRSLGNSMYGSSQGSFGFKWWVASGNYTYFSRLDDDPEYNDRYWNRWTALRRSIFAKEALFSRIETVYSQLTEGTAVDITSTVDAASMAHQVPVARHYRKYPNLGVTSFIVGQTAQATRTTWRQEVDAMKSWLAERLEWLDGAPQTIDTTTLAARLKPTDLINASTGLPQYGGNVPAGWQFHISNPNSSGGTTYYTINGADPRQPGGALDPAAQTAVASSVTASTVLANGQTWKWLQPAAAPANDGNGAPWTAEAYLDSAWSSGTAPLGYGETTGLAANISPTAPNYTVTSSTGLNAAGTGEPGPAYFRTTFTATGTSNLTGAMLEIIADDGAVVYLNGVEVARFNYPLAPAQPLYGQEALGPIDPGNNFVPIETTFFPVPFDKAKLKDGVNTLAVEVHQALYLFPPNPANPYPRNDFSDLRFDVRIIGLTAGGPADTYTLATPGAHVVRTRIKDGTTWSPVTEATFVVDAVPASAASLVVSELHYHPSDPTPAELALGFNMENDFEFIELMNISTTQAIDLSEITITDAVTFNFATAAAAARYLPPGGRVVVVENIAAFTSRLRPGANPIIAGAFNGNFSNGGEKVIICAADGSVIKQFTYNDKFPWAEAADGTGYSLVLNDPPSNPDHNLASSWHASARLHGAPGTDDHVPPAPGLVWDADADHDGINDSLEYAMGAGGTNPPVPSLSFEAFAPSGGAADIYLIYRFQRNLEAMGVVLQPQTSTDISVWGDADIVHIASVHNADGTSTETWRSMQPFRAMLANWFVRLSVTLTH
jgi:hypothetical protein